MHKILTQQTSSASDLLIRDLSAELVDATQERDIYREIAKGAIHALHQQTEDCRRLREQLRALRDEHRHLQAWADHQQRAAA